jgi:hypothetical protein
VEEPPAAEAEEAAPGGEEAGGSHAVECGGVSLRVWV